MSLINDMLKNLDAREARAAGGVHALPKAAPPEGARGRRTRGIAFVGAFAAVGLAWLWFAPIEIESSGAGATIAPAATLPEVSQAPAVAADAPLPVEVRRFALAETAQGTRLSLELSAPTAHRVVRRDDGLGLEVVLSGARLGSQIPPLDLQRSPLESFDVEQRDGDLHLVLGFALPLRLQSSMQAGADGAELALDLSGSRPPDPARDASPPPASPARSEAAPVPVVRPHPLGPGERAAELHRSALAARRGGDLARAESDLREALGLQPWLHDARSALVSLLLSGGRLAEVAALLDAGDVLVPDHAPFALLRARLLLAQGDVAAALAALERSAPPLAGDPEYHALHAALLSRKGEHARAAKAYARLVAIDAKRASWWLGLGISLEGQARRGDALAAYREAVRLTGLDAEAQTWVEGRIAALAPEG